MAERAQTDNLVTKTIYIDGCKVVINRPILTAEEQKRRERDIVSALSNFR